MNHRSNAFALTVLVILVLVIVLFGPLAGLEL